MGSCGRPLLPGVLRDPRVFAVLLLVLLGGATVAGELLFWQRFTGGDQLVLIVDLEDVERRGGRGSYLLSSGFLSVPGVGVAPASWYLVDDGRLLVGFEGVRGILEGYDYWNASLGLPTITLTLVNPERGSAVVIITTTGSLDFNAAYRPWLLMDRGPLTLNLNKTIVVAFKYTPGITTSKGKPGGPNTLIGPGIWRTTRAAEKLGVVAPKVWLDNVEGEEGEKLRAWRLFSGNYLKGSYLASKARYPDPASAVRAVHCSLLGLPPDCGIPVGAFPVELAFEAMGVSVRWEHSMPATTRVDVPLLIVETGPGELGGTVKASVHAPISPMGFGFWYAGFSYYPSVNALQKTVWREEEILVMGPPEWRDAVDVPWGENLTVMLSGVLATWSKDLLLVHWSVSDAGEYWRVTPRATIAPVYTLSLTPFNARPVNGSTLGDLAGAPLVELPPAIHSLARGGVSVGIRPVDPDNMLCPSWGRPAPPLAIPGLALDNTSLLGLNYLEHAITVESLGPGKTPFPVNGFSISIINRGVAGLLVAQKYAVDPAGWDCDRTWPPAFKVRLWIQG